MGTPPTTHRRRGLARRVTPRRSARALTPRDTMGSVAPDEAQETADALMFMADEFVRDDCPLQAVKCYEAICDKNNLTILPLPEARARLALARLLLVHTDNIHRAKTHLETTQMLLRSVHGHESLKCRTFSGLSRCYRSSAGPRSAPAADGPTQKGLDLSRFAAKKCPARERGAWRAWQLHFLLDKADLKMAQGDFRLARKTLAEGAAAAADAGDAEPSVRMWARLRWPAAARGRAEGRRRGRGLGRDGRRWTPRTRLWFRWRRRRAGRSARRPACTTASCALRLAAGNAGAPPATPRRSRRCWSRRRASTPRAKRAVRKTSRMALCLRRRKRRRDGRDRRSAFRERRRAASDGATRRARATGTGGFRRRRRARWRGCCARRRRARPASSRTRAAIWKRSSPSATRRSSSSACSPKAATRARRATKGKRRRRRRKRKAPVARRGRRRPLPPSRQWAGCEADPAPRVASDATPYLTMRMLALQSLVGIDLTSTKMDWRRRAPKRCARRWRRTARAPAVRGGGGHCRGAGASLRGPGGGGGGALRGGRRDRGGLRRARARDIGAVCGALSDSPTGRPGRQPRAQPGASGDAAARDDAAAAASQDRGGRGGGAQLRVPGRGVVRVRLRRA